MDIDDEYERERQDNIRKNQELLLSLGLNNKPARSGARQRSQRDVGEKAAYSDAAGGDGSSSARISARLSARPRRSYGSSSKAPSRPIPRGTRRSARLSSERNKSKKSDSLPALISIEQSARRAPISMLKRLKNPAPPSAALRRQQEEEDEEQKVYARAALPTRDSNGNIIFENNNRHFMPNVTPKEMLRGGIFGGTAFRPYFSSMTGTQLSSQEDLREFPSDWYSGLDVPTQLASRDYDPSMNRFGVKAGQTLEEWENAGWVRRQDPRGWWQWYFRFYLGRRTSDDSRQIGRFLKACGPSGRFKRSLVSKIHSAGATFDDETISPVVRQTLFHWAYQLNEKDYYAYL